VLSLIACGGGGGGSAPAVPSLTISGVAAAGAPIIGFAYLKDKNNKEAGPAAIDQSGNFSFTLDSTYVAPFVLKAEGAAGGQGYKLYSAATGYGTANINPLTNLAVAAATGKNPDAVYADVSASSASVNSTALAAAVNDIKAMLQPLLEAKSITQFDPLSGAYKADGTGLDGVLDVVKVQVNADNSVNLINKTTNGTISSGTIDSLPAAIDSATATQLSTTITDLEAIAQGLAQFATTLNKGASLTAADLEPFFVGTEANPDAYGYNNGFDRQQDIADFVMMFSQGGIDQLGGLKEVKNLTLVKKIDPQNLINAVTHAATTLTEIYQIKADFYFGDGSFGAPEGPMLIAKEGGKWKLLGNQRLIDVEGHASAHKWIKADGTTLVKTGMEIYLEDIGFRGVNSVRIEGPGMPVGGITFSKTQQSVNMLILDQQDYTLPTNQWSFIPLDDVTIGSLSEEAEAYTVTLYADLTAPVDTNAQYLQRFKETIVKKPVLNAALKAGDFGTATMQGLDHSMTFANANMMDKTVTVGITRPTGYVVKWTEAHIHFWAGGPGIYVDKTVSKTADTVSLIVPSASGFTPSGGQLGISTEDQFGRSFRYGYMFQ